jgi:integrase
MAGPWQHPDSGIFYYRKATPTDLLANKSKLAGLGVRVTREVHRSLGTRDKVRAEREFIEVARAQDSKWSQWRAMLLAGPVDLTHRNRVALAGSDAWALVRENADEPNSVRWPVKMIKAFCDNLRSSLGASDLRVANALHELATELQSLPRLELPERLAHLLQTEPAGPRRELVEALTNALVTYRETVGWMRAPKLAEAKGLSLTKQSRKELAHEVAKWWGKGWEALRRYHDGNYGQPDWVAGIPELKPMAGVEAAPLQSSTLSLTGLLEEKHRTKEMTPTDFRVWKAKLGLFVKFVGHDDARRITRDDVRRWRTSLLDGGRVSAGTINKKHMAALKSVLNFGVREHGLAENVANITPLSRQSAKGHSLAKGYSEEQAKAILAAAFRGSARDLSEPHKRAIRWVPWILAFTGLRVSEVTQFQGRHIEEVGDIYLMHIHGDDGRNKTSREWFVPIHPQLVEMGLTKMFDEIGDGPAFYEAYPDGVRLDTLEATHRGKYTPHRISAWIKHEVGIKPPNEKPSHAWRHRFTTLSRSVSMDAAARDFMMGSAPRNEREKYGGFTPERLYAEIAKLPYIKLD